MAEFQEVMRQRKRMCKAMGDICLGCEFYKIGRSTSPRCLQVIVDTPYRAETIIMDWAAEHPEKSMKDVFFEKFPNAPRDELGDPRMCPLDVGYPARPDGAGYEGECHTENPCTGCWSRPAPEE